MLTYGLKKIIFFPFGLTVSHTYSVEQSQRHQRQLSSGRILKHLHIVSIYTHIFKHTLSHLFVNPDRHTDANVHIWICCIHLSIWVSTTIEQTEIKAFVDYISCVASRYGAVLICNVWLHHFIKNKLHRHLAHHFTNISLRSLTLTPPLTKIRGHLSAGP